MKKRSLIMILPAIFIAVCFAVVLLLTACSSSKSSTSETAVDKGPKYAVQIYVDCEKNLMFSRYDVDMSVDGEEVGNIEHGSEATFEVRLAKGQHELRFVKEGHTSPDGNTSFVVEDEGDKFSYKISCTKDQIEIESVKEEAESTSDLLTSYQVEPKTVVLEYSKKTVDPLTLVEQPEDKRIELGTEDDASLDLTVLGKQTVAYTVHCDGEKNTQKVAFEVVDTHNPEIRILSKDVTVEQGGGYNPRDNVESVTDPVDGSLAFVETEPAKLANSKDGKVYESGWYTLEGDYDDNNPTKYFILVAAVDIHGNKSTKEFSVMVNAAPSPEPEPESMPETETAPAPVEQQVQVAPVPETHNYILNTNTGKFHYEYCPDVKKMKDKNKLYMNATHDEVVALGYSPCQRCNP